ncbi:MAG: hypothetical protein EOP33_07345 [Rickettsiaceae bacterium]|nr:MAG: hypothetical protein EOP33_07345 [Rickettsiaceae bacterium]
MVKVKSYKRKALSEFHPLSEEEAEVLRKTSGREFNLNFINQLLLKLAKSRPNNGFFTKDLFMSYMAKVLTYELHQAVTANNEGFKFKAVVTEETINNKHQEQYLEEVEYSKDTSCKGQLRRKIAAVFEADTAYKILSGYKFDYSDEKKKGSKQQEGNSPEFKLVALNNHNRELSTSEQARLLAQVQAVYGNNIEKLVITRLEPPIAQINTSRDTAIGNVTSKLKVFLNEPSSVWQQVSSALLKHYGEAVHVSWFSKLVAQEDKTNRKLMLKAPTKFIKSWIEEKYGYLISNLLKDYEYSYKIC